MAAVLSISGCRTLLTFPSGELFGEVTYSSDKAEDAYDTFAADFRQEQREAWDGYVVG